MSNDDRIVFSFQTDSPWYLHDVSVRYEPSAIELVQNGGFETGALSPFKTQILHRGLVGASTRIFNIVALTLLDIGTAAAPACSLKP